MDAEQSILEAHGLTAPDVKAPFLNEKRWKQLANGKGDLVLRIMDHEGVPPRDDVEFEPLARFIVLAATPDDWDGNERVFASVESFTWDVSSKRAMQELRRVPALHDGTTPWFLIRAWGKGTGRRYEVRGIYPDRTGHKPALLDLSTDPDEEESGMNKSAAEEDE